MSSEVPSFVLSDEQKSRLVWSKRHLQDALTLTPQVCRPYRTVLARVLYSLGEFGEAAEEYHKAFTERHRFVHPSSPDSAEDYRWESSFMTALCFRRAGNLDRAISVLQRDSSSPPVGSCWWIAKWYSELGQYDKAAELLVQESEGPLSLPESWQLSTVLALAKLSQIDERAEEFAERLARTNPEMQEVIVGLSAQLWPRFPQLSDRSKAYWLHGVAELHGSALFPGAEGISANTAIKDFEWIVEFELRTRLFETFRTVVQSGETRQTAQSDAREWRDNQFFKFLISAHPKIALGAMATALEDCSSSVIPTHVE